MLVCGASGEILTTSTGKLFTHGGLRPKIASPATYHSGRAGSKAKRIGLRRRSPRGRNFLGTPLSEMSREAARNQGRDPAARKFLLLARTSCGAIRAKRNRRTRALRGEGRS